MSLSKDVVGWSWANINTNTLCICLTRRYILKNTWVSIASRSVTKSEGLKAPCKLHEYYKILSMIRFQSTHPKIIFNFRLCIVPFAQYFMQKEQYVNECQRPVLINHIEFDASIFQWSCDGCSTDWCEYCNLSDWVAPTQHRCNSYCDVTSYWRSCVGE